MQLARLGIAQRNRVRPLIRNQRIRWTERGHRALALDYTRGAIVLGQFPVRRCDPKPLEERLFAPGRGSEYPRSADRYISRRGFSTSPA
jgi:hypothetical protein